MNRITYIKQCFPYIDVFVAARQERERREKEIPVNPPHKTRKKNGKQTGIEGATLM